MEFLAQYQHSTAARNVDVAAVRALASNVQDTQRSTSKYVENTQVAVIFLIQMLTAGYTFGYIVFFFTHVLENYYNIDQGLWVIVAFMSAFYLFSPTACRMCQVSNQNIIKLNQKSMCLAVIIITILLSILGFTKVPWFIHVLFYGVFGGLYTSIINATMKETIPKVLLRKPAAYHLITQMSKSLSLCVMPYLLTKYFYTWTESMNPLVAQIIINGLLIPISLLLMFGLRIENNTNDDNNDDDHPNEQINLQTRRRDSNEDTLTNITSLETDHTPSTSRASPTDCEAGPSHRPDYPISVLEEQPMTYGTIITTLIKVATSYVAYGIQSSLQWNPWLAYRQVYAFFISKIILTIMPMLIIFLIPFGQLRTKTHPNINATTYEKQHSLFSVTEIGISWSLTLVFIMGNCIFINISEMASKIFLFCGLGLSSVCFAVWWAISSSQSIEIICYLFGFAHCLVKYNEEIVYRSLFPECHWQEILSKSDSFTGEMVLVFYTLIYIANTVMGLDPYTILLLACFSYVAVIVLWAVMIARHSYIAPITVPPPVDRTNEDIPQVLAEAIFEDIYERIPIRALRSI